MQLLLYQKYFCWQPTASKNKTCSVTDCFPIEDSLLPRGKVYSHKSPKVVDFVRRPSPNLHSTSNTFAPHLTILFNVREHVRKFLAFPRSAAVDPPTVVRGPDPRCEQAASVADTQRAPWLIEQEKPRRLFVMSSISTFLQVALLRTTAPTTAACGSSTGARDASMAPVLLLRRCDADWSNWWANASQKYES